MYKGEIIDTHMHLWDLKNNYPWLTTNVPTLEYLGGDYNKLKHNFLGNDYFKLAQQQKITKSIHVEAFGFEGNPILETQWLQKQADLYGFPHGIIARAELHDPHIEETLKQHAQYPNLRGIRMVLNYHDNPLLRMADRGDYLKDTQWRKGYSLLSKYNLIFELQIFDTQIEDAVNLIRDFPNIPVVIEHLAWPLDLSAKGFSKWKQRITRLANYPNVFMKLSGLGWVFKKVELSLLTSYIVSAINLFGPDRCMFGSNFPPDSLFYNFNELVDKLKVIFTIFTEEEQHKIFYKNAEKIYNL
jgi:predicted TIM-barrel fold metal-dependent hydrolase